MRDKRHVFLFSISLPHSYFGLSSRSFLINMADNYPPNYPLMDQLVLTQEQGGISLLDMVVPDFDTNFQGFYDSESGMASCQEIDVSVHAKNSKISVFNCYRSTSVRDLGIWKK